MMCSASIRLTISVLLATAVGGSFVMADDDALPDVSAPAVVNPQPPEPNLPGFSQRQVRNFVNQLASDRFAERRAATEKLIAIGPTAVEQLAQAVRTGDIEVQLRAFKCLEAFFGSQDFEAVAKTWEILETFTEDTDGLVAERSRELLSRYGQVRGRLAIKHIESMNGIVRMMPRGNGVFPDQTMVGIDSNWTGGDKGLQFLKILREKGMPPAPTVYVIQGAPVSKDAIAQLEKSLANSAITVHPRGRASLGIAGSRNLRALRGCEVRDVTGRPAANAGIRPNDVILKFGDRDVEDFQHLVELIREYDVGDEVDVEYERNGQTKLTQVKLGGWQPMIRPPAIRPQNARPQNGRP